MAGMESNGMAPNTHQRHGFHVVDTNQSIDSIPATTMSPPPTTSLHLLYTNFEFVKLFFGDVIRKKRDSGFQNRTATGTDFTIGI